MLSFCTGAYPYLSNLNVSLKYRGVEPGWVSCCCTDTGLSSGMHLGSLVKFQGGGIVVKFDVFLQCYAFVCAVCMQAMTHSVDNVPSQQAVNLVVVGLGFVDQLQRKMK